MKCVANETIEMCDISHLLPSPWSEEVDLGIQRFSWIQQISGPTSFSVPAFSILPQRSNQNGISRCSFVFYPGV